MANIDGCHYLVEKGDSLWTIAKNRLGNGMLFAKIVDQNKKKYPTFTINNTLQIGWELKVDCNT